MTASDWINGQQNPLIERVLAWSNINSGSRNIPGLHRAAKAIHSDYEALEPESCEVESSGATDSRPFIILRKRETAPHRLLFFGHLDTVYGPEHPLQHASLVSKDKLTGPGVCDMKGGLAILLCGLSAFESFVQQKNFGWTILINSDEEIGSPNSSKFFEQEARAHRYGFGFEPALEDGSLASSRRGSGTFAFKVHGKAAHSGRNPRDGRNALIPIARLILACQQLNEERGSIFVNPAIVSGGTVTNVVPDLAACHLNVRTTTAQDEEWLRQEFERLRIELEHGSDYRIELSGNFTAPPKILTPDIAWLLDLAQSAAAQIGLQLTAERTGGTCDGNRLAQYGLPNLDNLGARGGAIHSENEFLFPDSLVERSLLLFTILELLNQDLRS